MSKFWFGPAGKPISMKSSDILKAPQFLREIGLNAMEYEAVRGVKISESKARAFGEEASKHGVLLSLHAPYYVNLASAKKSIVEDSVRRIIESVQASAWMNSYVVVFHSGYYKDAPSKREALEWVIKSLRKVVDYMSENKIGNTWLGPETTGKTTQVGDLSEVIEIARRVERTRPVVDWAHLYARHGGKLITSVDDVLRVVETIEKELGDYAVKPLHTHFSRIEYSRGGEREHHTLAEKDYGPEFSNVCRALCEAGVDAVVISESPILEQDAIVMRNVCSEVCGAKCVVV